MEAESAEVTPLQVLPPMVPMLRIWGPPTWSTASPQHMEVFLDQGIPGDVGKAGEGADPQGAVCLQGHAPELIQPVDGDQLHPARLPSRICTSTSDRRR